MVEDDDGDEAIGTVWKGNARGCLCVVIGRWPCDGYFGAPIGPCQPVDFSPPLPTPPNTTTTTWTNTTSSSSLIR